MMQTHFPSQIPPGRNYRLAQALNSAGVPLTFSTGDCLSQKQPGEQSLLLGSVSHDRIAVVQYTGNEDSKI